MQKAQSVTHGVHSVTHGEQNATACCVGVSHLRTGWDWLMLSSSALTLLVSSVNCN
jgi:hypothetical protein